MHSCWWEIFSVIQIFNCWIKWNICSIWVMISSQNKILFKLNFLFHVVNYAYIIMNSSFFIFIHFWWLNLNSYSERTVREFWKKICCVIAFCTFSMLWMLWICFNKYPFETPVQYHTEVLHIWNHWIPLLFMLISCQF